MDQLVHFLSLVSLALTINDAGAISISLRQEQCWSHLVKGGFDPFCKHQHCNYISWINIGHVLGLFIDI